jgi:folate-binding Fe-S cluster repair protein YgfZ
MFELTAGVGAASDELVWVEGADAVEFLDGQVTQDVRAMSPGEVRRSLLLEPRGRLRAILWVLRDADRVGLVTPAGTGTGVMADIDRFRFRVRSR